MNETETETEMETDTNEVKGKKESGGRKAGGTKVRKGD